MYCNNAAAWCQKNPSKQHLPACIHQHFRLLLAGSDSYCILLHFPLAIIPKKNVCKYVLTRCSPCVTTSSSLPWERTFYSRLGIFTSAGTAHIQTSCSLFVQLCNCAPCEPFVVCDLTFIVAYTFWLYLGKVNPSLRGCTVPYVQDITKRAPSVPVWMRGMFVCVCVCVWVWVCSHTSEHEGTKPSPYGPLFLEGYDSCTPPLDVGGIEHSLANI